MTKPPGAVVHANKEPTARRSLSWLAARLQCKGTTATVAAGDDPASKTRFLKTEGVIRRILDLEIAPV